MIRIKGKLSPDVVDVSNLKVFISYKTEERDFALGISTKLREIGFQVHMEEPSSTRHALSRQEIQAKLSRLVNEADCVCLVTSEQSIKSRWVAFEFKEAAQTIGRVVFACNKCFVDAGDHLTASLSPWGLSTSILTKHTTLYFPDVTDKHVNDLAVELINDPDEGWYDGIYPGGPRPPSRDLKKESLRRKAARKEVLRDPYFSGTRIQDVLPFTWDEAGCTEGDIEKALQWVVFGCGRLNLVAPISNMQIGVVDRSYSVPGSEVMSANPIETIHAFVIVASPPR